MATLWTIVQVMLFIIAHTNGYCYSKREIRSEYNSNYYDCYYCNVTQKNGEWTVEGLDISLNGHTRIIRISMQNLKFSDFTLQTVITGEFNYFSIVEVIIEDSQIDRIVNFAFPKQKLFGYDTRDVNYRFVSFKNNNISTIEPNAFSNLESVTKFSFSNNIIGNKIGAITSLSKLVGVTTLDLSNNNITSISNELITANKNIQHLNLSNSQISQIALGRLPSLEIVDLSNNYLVSISNRMFPEISAIKHLNISNNQINQIYPNTFANMQSLEHLDLSHNQIKHMHIASLHGLLHLQSLNLSYNQVTVDKYLIFNTPQLSFLDISYNNLSDIDETLFKESHLTSINIDGMHVSCIRLVEIVKYFKTLNINYVVGKEQNRLHLFGMHCNHSDVIETTTNIIEPTNIPNTDIQLSNISNKLSEMLNVLKHNNDKNVNVNSTQADTTTTTILLILLILMLGFIIVFFLYIWRTYFVNSNQYVPTENLITDFELSNK
ncbi:chaoptin-like [Atheta coriaria]|uniref:chaoptin-like n=1 Tax=Dalotia coriaria TaxID=877792 RepID=UPI0031F3CB49